MIEVTTDIQLDEKELNEEFIRSSGPGGQNVNKVATSVQLKFDVENSPSISDQVRRRIIRLAGRRVNKEGILVIKAGRFRTQEMNRRDAINRLVALIRKAARVPKHRIKTRPTGAAKRRRLELKRRRGEIKRRRRPVSGTDY
jgi:ribosome-associated protein